MLRLMIKRVCQIVFAVLFFVFIILIGFRSAAYLREQDTVETVSHSGKLTQTAMGRINVTQTGTHGPTVLLLHGTAAWGGLWQETANALAKAGYRSFAPDLPPFGFSDRDPTGDYSRTTQAQRVLALVAAMPEKPILVAHSFGASAGVEAALQSPESFDGLVIVAGALAVGGHEKQTTNLPWPANKAKLREFAVALTATNPMATRFLLKQMLHRKDRATEKYANILRLPLSQKGTTKAVSQWAPSLLLPPKNAASTRRDAYKTLPLTTEIIWGDKDSITPLPQGQELHALIPKSRITVLQNVGHIPQIEDPSTFQTQLIAALSRISSGAE